MLILNEIMPDWRNRVIHESSPADRGASRILQAQCRNYTASHFYPSIAPGELHEGFRNENLESQTFGAETFDLVVSIDVMEHVFHPNAAYGEIYRTLKPGGYYIHTFPIRKWQTEAATPRAELLPDGTVRHLVNDPEYHVNPVDPQGSLVTFDYGYDVVRQIREWAPFDVRIMRFCDEWHGLIGEYTEVIVCAKRAEESTPTPAPHCEGENGASSRQDKISAGTDKETEMLEYGARVLAEAEENAASAPLSVTLQALRELTLGEFGEFMWSLPNPAYKHLSAVLPRMADPLVQTSWTGIHGLPLLVQTYDFVSRLDYNYSKLKGRRLANARMLDFGCGYGRMLRLMYYFSDPEKLWGIDPWEEAIQICRHDNLLGNLAVSSYLPTSLPVGVQRFDVIYAFSVFTHTSERATVTALATLRDYIAEDGLCAITIRPKEFWAADPGYSPAADVFERTHEATGFAFAPHPRPAVDGDITYGDTSMSVAWFEHYISGWKIVGRDRSLNDPYQIVLFLSPT